MFTNLQRTDGGFNPHLKRCYNEVFSPLTEQNLNNNNFLLACYERHQRGIEAYFNNRAEDILTINVNDNNSYVRLLDFLSIERSKGREGGFKKINLGGKVKAWQGLNNKYKVESTNKGKIDKTLY
jgi:hypothetical protein